jgi:predicted transcriptional regulator
MSKGPRQTTSSDPLRRLIEEKGWTNAKAAKALFLSESAIRNYLNTGVMPGTVTMAVSGLRKELDRPEVLVVVGARDELDKVKAVSGAMGLRVAYMVE